MIAIAICICAMLWILWTLAGYPAWLAYRATHAARAVKELEYEPTVTAIIPVHNGGRFLEAKLESVLASDYPASRLEILVLSDGSTDDTDAIAERYRDAGKIEFLRLPKGGKATALSVAFQHAGGDVFLLTDVRQRIERDCLRVLTRHLADAEVGVVSGTLKIRRGETAGEEGTGLYWKYESWIRRNLSSVDSILGATGPIYAIKRELTKPLPAACILDDVWLPYQAILGGKRSVVAASAVAWDYPTSLTSEFNRKVRTQAGLYQVMRQEPRLLQLRQNRLFWAFLNLKIGRLLTPHALIVFLLASAWLPAPWNVVVLLLQAAFYGGALLEKGLGAGSPFKRVLAPLSAFVTLMAAAFCAQAIFFRDPAELWKPTQVRLTPDGRS